MTKRTDQEKRRGKYRSVPAVVLGFALAGVVLAACGGGAARSAPATSTKKTTTTTTPSSSSSASSTAFTTCLKQHGVTGSGFGSGKKPTGSTGTRPAGGFGGNSKTSAAFKACASLRPAGSGFGGGGGAGGASSTQLAAFRNCMTLHGVTVPTKTAGSAPSANSSVTSSPKYKTALAACSSLIPSAGKTTTTTPAG